MSIQQNLMTSVASTVKVWEDRDQLRMTATNIWGISSSGVYYIVWDGAQYVAAGLDRNFNASIATSSDGITWTHRPHIGTLVPQAAGYALRSLHYREGLYLTSSFGAGKLYSSTDAITWTERANISTLLSTVYITKIVWGNNNYVATGYSGKAATSPDGITWSSNSSITTVFSTTNILNAVWTGSQFIAVGTQKCATSPDGLTWTSRTSFGTAWGNSELPYAAETNTAGNLTIVAGTNGKVVTSIDGITWTNRTSNLTSTAWGTGVVYCIHWDGAKFVAVGSGGRVATTTDAVTWTIKTGLTSTYWGSVDAIQTVATNTAGSFIIGGVNSKVATTPDLSTWTYRDDLSRASTVWGYNDVRVLFNDGSKTFAGGLNSSLASVNNGEMSWTLRRESLVMSGWPTTKDILAMAYSGSLYLLVGENGWTATSTDGITWTGSNSLRLTGWSANDASSTTNAMSVCWMGDKFFVGGGTGRSATTTDGVNWTYQTITGASDINGCAWSGSLILLSAGGKTFTSPDAVTWTDRGLFPGWQSDSLTFAIYGNSKFLIGAGGQGRTAASSDGINWTTGDLSSTGWGTSFAGTNGAAWTGTQFVIVGNTGRVATSANGVNWVFNPSLKAAWGGNAFTGIAYAVSGVNSRLLAGGTGARLGEYL